MPVGDDKSKINIAVLSDRYKRMSTDLESLQREFKDVRETVKAIGSVLDVIKENIDSFTKTVSVLNNWKLVEDTLKTQDRRNIDLLSNDLEQLMTAYSETVVCLNKVEEIVNGLKCSESSKRLMEIEKVLEPMKDRSNRVKDTAWKMVFEIVKFGVIGAIGFIIARLAS